MTSRWCTDEAGYVRYLEGERRAYAWVLRTYGGRTATQSDAEAMESYPYESADEPYRGLVFHDEPWHWAMRRIFGDRYEQERPEPAEPSGGYPEL
ncbi:hypothetical protein ACFUJR_35710 [Streptomyces sp. NPDC057271]|uniref:hypothetical protein n=1 Tax=unclassified Streptomyces TaxID=2593676 RepID=UPI00362EF5D8